jgi:hypothetical protein
MTHTGFLIYLILLTIGGIYGIFAWDKLSRPFRILTIFLVVTAIHEGVTRFEWVRDYTYHQYWLYTSFWMICWTMIYSHFLRNSYLQYFILAFGYILSIVPIVTVALALKANEPLDFPGSFLVIVNVFMLLSAVLMFFRILRHSELVPLRHHSLFWLTTAFFIYGGLSFFLYFLIDYFNQDHGFQDWSWESILQFTSVYPFYSLLIFSIYVNSTTKHSDVN